MSLTFLLSLACAPPLECTLQSTLEGFQPDCSAELVQYPQESRLALSGDSGTLLAYLPPELQPETIYGGTSGSPLIVILELALPSGVARTLSPIERTSTLSLIDLRVGSADLYLSLSFEEGALSGPISVPVRRE